MVVMVTEHISDEGLLALVDGTLSNEDRQRALTHAITCESCHELLVAAAPAVGTGPGDDTEHVSLVRGAEIGRYTLLENIGRGATAEVHTAYDPQLDRKIALKLLHTGVRGSLLREAQALARLAHPNVVSVFEIGEHDGHAFVAMEFVAGETLASWMARRAPWPRVVEIFLGAGRGLAAAHRVGIVHRDFKPENVLVGSDGRPRVVDFGLARNTRRGDSLMPLDENGVTTLTAPGVAVGTPAYMAPEQLRGEDATAASDQFAFCVALWEALYGVRPFADVRGRARLTAIERGAVGDPLPDARVPMRLRRVLVRGLAASPASRWPSLDHLLAALERALPGRRRAITAGILAAVVGIGTTVAITTPRSSPPAAPCASAGTELAADWNDQLRTALRTRLATLGAYGREEETRIASMLDEQAVQWSAASRAACVANNRRELTQQLYERTLGCLQRARSAFMTAVDVVAHTSAESLPDAIVAVRSLPDPGACRALTLVARVAPPPREIADAAAATDLEIERARILALAGNADAVARAANVAATSERSGYLPHVARARLAEGTAWLVRRDVKALAPLERAAKAALQAGDDATFVEAYARWLFATALARRDVAAARAGLELAEPIALRLTLEESFARALLFNNAGALHLAAEDRDSARRWFERAIAEPRTRTGDLELVAAYGNLALLTDDPGARAALIASERSVLEAGLGPNHPRTLDAAQKTAMTEPDSATAFAQIRTVCDRMQRFHPTTLATQLDDCHFELAWLADTHGDRGEARARLAQTRAEGIYAVVARAYVALFDDRHADAIRGGIAAADQLSKVWWTQPYAADALAVAARAEYARGDKAKAHALLARARSLLAALPATPYHGRRLARIDALIRELR